MEFGFIITVVFLIVGVILGYTWGYADRETNCTCKDSTGWTQMPCCNICGKQVEGK